MADEASNSPIGELPQAASAGDHRQIEIFTHRLELPPYENPIDPKALPSGGGVYGFLDKEYRVIQVLSAQSIRRSAAGRLASEEPSKRRADLRAIARHLSWIPTYSVFESMWTYLQIARRLKPAKYRADLAFGPAWFAAIKPCAPFPEWRAEKIAFEAQTDYVGPFVRRRQCTEFVEALEDGFDLCRYHDILVQAPDGEPCVYKEMGKCGAPCDGTVSMDDYRALIARSLAFARDEVDDRLDELKSIMSSCAANRDYPAAARIREQLARLEKASRSPGRLQRDLDDVRYLVIQKGAKRSDIKPFFVDRGAIEPGESTPLKAIAEVAEIWRDAAQRRFDQPESRAVASENVWLIARFLAKGDKAPGLFLNAAHDLSTDNLIDRVRKHFSRPAKRPSPPPAY